MGFTLDQVVPWGRSFDEYCRMFALSDADLAGRILGCGDGPAAFNADATRRGTRVVSCDPIYRWSARQLDQRIADTCERILDETRRNRDEFVWDEEIPSVDALGRLRRRAMRTFLADFESGTTGGRYVAGELPQLPFAAKAFDLALCSHLLFLYTTQLGQALHQAGARELCRVASEVRIFPLLALGGRPSPLVQLVADQLRQDGYDVRIELVPYEFQRGGNEMLRVLTQQTAG